MKASKERNFENVLPAGYRQALYLNAKQAKLGILLNLIAVAICAAVMVVAVFLLRAGGYTMLDVFDVPGWQIVVAYFVLLLAMVAYVVLHELVHGVAYKTMTGEKLTFGISWSCAFCGVPQIYTYRKTALIAVLSPFLLFTAVLLPLLGLLYVVSPLYFLIAAFIFGMHLGGCSGDLYVFFLLAVKFRARDTLMRDTGPEQFFYVRDK